MYRQTFIAGLAILLAIVGAEAKSLGNALLQRDTWALVKIYAEGMGTGCKAKLIGVKVTRQTSGKVKNGILVSGGWSENWTVAVCKKKLIFPIDFKASPRGGTDLTIHPPR